MTTDPHEYEPIVDPYTARLYELAETVAIRHPSAKYLHRVAPDVQGRDPEVGDPVAHLFQNARVGGRYMAAETAKRVLTQAVTNHYDLQQFTTTQQRPLRAALRLLRTDPCVGDSFLTTTWKGMSIPGARLLMQSLEPTLDATEVEEALDILDHATLTCLKHERPTTPCANGLD